MTIKIDAPRVDIQLQPGGWLSADTLTSDYARWGESGVPGRILRESTYRKLMAVVGAVDAYTYTDTRERGELTLAAIDAAIALRKHLQKKK